MILIDLLSVWPASPPPYDPPAPLDDKSRPLSTGSFEAAGGSLTGSGSEMSLGEAPQVRKIKGRVASSPRMSERPKVCTHMSCTCVLMFLCLCKCANTCITFRMLE